MSWEHKLSKLRISYDILNMYLLSDHIRKLTQRSSLVQTRCQVLHRSQGCRSSTEEPSPEGHLGNTWAQTILKRLQGYIAEKIVKFLVKEVQLSTCSLVFSSPHSRPPGQGWTGLPAALRSFLGEQSFLQLTFFGRFWARFLGNMGFLFFTY